MINDYEHLPIGKYLQILELAKVEDNDLAIVAALSGRTEDELLNMPLTEYRTLADAAGFLFLQPSPAKARDSYEVGGMRLRLTRKAKYITTAQYIDFKEYAKAGEADICRYLAIILVPEGKAYNDGYDVDEVCEAIRTELPTTDALGVRDFFLGRLERLTADSLTSSRRMAARLKDPEKRTEMMTRIAEAEAFMTSGAGYGMLITSLNSPAAVGTRYMRFPQSSSSR